MGIMSIPFAQFHVGGECGNAYLGWPYADECLGHRVSSTYGLISQTFPTRSAMVPAGAVLSKCQTLVE